MNPPIRRVVKRGDEYGWTTLAGEYHYGQVKDVDSNVVCIGCQYCGKEVCTDLAPDELGAVPPVPTEATPVAERREGGGTTGGRRVELLNPPRHPLDEFLKWRKLAIRYLRNQQVPYSEITRMLNLQNDDAEIIDNPLVTP